MSRVSSLVGGQTKHRKPYLSGNHVWIDGTFVRIPVLPCAACQYLRYGAGPINDRCIILIFTLAHLGRHVLVIIFDEIAEQASLLEIGEAALENVVAHRVRSGSRGRRSRGARGRACGGALNRVDLRSSDIVDRTRSVRENTWRKIIRRFII